MPGTDFQDTLEDLGASGNYAIVTLAEPQREKWGSTMDEARIRTLKQAILELPEGERQQLAEELLPLLLTTRAGLRGIDQVLQTLSDEEIDALVERARERTKGLPDAAVEAVIGEALRAIRTQSRS